MHVRSILLASQVIMLTSPIGMIASGESRQNDVPPAPWQGSSQIIYEQVSSDQRALVEWAAGLFRQAGLQLPPFRVRAHVDRAECDGNIGLFSVIDGLAVIDFCSEPKGTAAGTLVLHELAHAWTWHQLESDREQAFEDLRGFAHWSGAAVPWHEQGREQAAEILVWGLFDQPIGSVRIYGNSCGELLAGYLALTGTQPLYGFTEVCAKA